MREILKCASQWANFITIFDSDSDSDKREWRSLLLNERISLQYLSQIQIREMLKYASQWANFSKMFDSDSDTGNVEF